MKRAWNAIRNRWPKLEFLAALLVGAGYELWQKGHGVLTAFRAKPEDEVDQGMIDSRLNCCQRCPIYYEPLRTCGSPLNKGARWPNGNPKGCFCWTPKKAANKANCWAYDNDPGYGWPKELNSFPMEDEV